MRKAGSFYSQMVGFHEKCNEPGGLKFTNFLTTAVITKMCKYWNWFYVVFEYIISHPSQPIHHG
jgi:hypothetical protein